MAGEALKLIAAVVQRGKAADAPVQAALKAGAPAATVFFGPGQGIRERLGLLGLAVQPEKEVILIVIDERLLDRVREAMVKAGHLDQPGVGFAFVTAVERAVGLLDLEGAQGRGTLAPRPRGDGPPSDSLP